jgi:methylmalonyl-CoA carboxyltransferase large subunit
MRNAQIEIADIAGQVDSLRKALELQMDELRAAQAEMVARMKTLEHSVTALELRKPEPVVATPKVEAKPVAQPQVAAPKTAVAEGISEEVMLVIAAAVAAFVGKSARVRSARYLQEGQSPWAQQGRVFVQASHNLAHRS